jgi:hypothetical protein
MPLSGDDQLVNTSRTPGLGSMSDLAAHIAEIRDTAAAAGRTEHIDVVYQYIACDRELATDDADRHREALAEAENAGVTWMVAACMLDDQSATLEWLEAFAEVFIQ